MRDANKEKFIYKVVDKIKYITQRIEEARKNKENIPEVMQQIQEDIQAIKDESQQIFKESGVKMSPEELDELIQNPSNFSQGDWELLQEIKRETEICKKEIIKSGEKEDVKELIGRKNNNKNKKMRPKYL